MSDSPQARGRWAETLACVYLRGQGYRLLARNVRCGRGEIDCVAQQAGVLCFIEVRARTSAYFGRPAETIDAGKIRRLGRAALHYCRSLRGPWPRMRFDVVEVLLRQPPVLTLIRDAFELPG